MSQTYSTTNLALNDPTDAGWALAYVRFATRDKPDAANVYPPDSLQDEEINAYLEATKEQDAVANGGDGSYYYRPHEAAARVIDANPAFLARWSVGPYSEERRTPGSIARGILRQGAWIEDAIVTATSGRLGGSGLELVT